MNRFSRERCCQYTDNDPFVCEWLRELVGRGHLGPGEVVEADVRDVRPSETLHTFCGIGGWPLALDWAGWPRDVPVWTGSCPCQPFSTAGRRRGTDDERHLWPAWLDLIEEHRPLCILGEQVASPDGRTWLAAVQTDLEDLGYSFGAADLCAAGVGAPHLRQRLYFLAVADGERREGLRLQLRQRRPLETVPEAPRGGAPGLVGDAGSSGGRRDAGAVSGAQAEGSGERVEPGDLADQPLPAGWSDVQWIWCQDGKHRPTQPGLQPLVDGVPGRLGRLRAYGNAIVPQAAAVFVRAAMEVILEGAT